MPSLKYIIIKSESQLCIDKILQWKAVHGLRKFENIAYCSINNGSLNSTMLKKKKKKKKSGKYKQHS